MLQVSSGDNELGRSWPLSLHHIYSCCHLARLLLETFPIPNQRGFMAQQGTISKGGTILHLQHSQKLPWRLNCAKNSQVLNDLSVGHLHRSWSQERGASPNPSSWCLQGMGGNQSCGLEQCSSVVWMCQASPVHPQNWWIHIFIALQAKCHYLDEHSYPWNGRSPILPGFMGEKK